MYFRFFSMMTRGLAALALVFLFASTSALHAQQPANSSGSATASADSHLVPSVQLDEQVQASSAARQKRVEDLTQFLSTRQAEKAMKDAKIDPAQVRTAIPSLSDAELAELSARADRAQHDFAAGTMSNQTLLIIILVLVAVILIAVIR